jgi:hypothetical protein
VIDPFQPGFVAFHLLLAGALTLVLGLVLLVLYRRAVARLMRLSSRSASVADVVPSDRQPAAPAVPLAIEILDAGPASGGRRPLSPTFRGARAAMARAAGVYALGGGVFAAIGTLLHLGFGTFGVLPMRVFVWFWVLAWPTVVTLALLWGPDRRRQATILAAYLGALVLAGLYLEFATDTGVLEPAPGVRLPAVLQPLFLWGLLAAPGAFLLLFLNRRVRAIGPVLLAFMIVAAFGVGVAVLAMDHAPVQRALAVVAVTAGIPIEALFWGVQLVGLIVFAVPAWLVARALSRGYQWKQTSDQALVFDAIWLLATLWLCSGLIREAGWWGWSGLAGFAGYKLVTVAGLRPLAARAYRRPMARLLLLRVFGFRTRAERLFALLAARWRYAGSIQLIAAPDLAGMTIEPAEFLDFVSGRLRRTFVLDERDLDRRLAEIDLRPDPDGRFRVNEFFCGNDTWQAVVSRLMQASDLVAMDLRGFAPHNQGCLFEIRTLLRVVPVDRIVLIVDRTTAIGFLEETLRDAWWRSGRGGGSGLPEPVIRLLRSTGSDVRGVRTLIALGDQALAAATPAAG